MAEPPSEEAPEAALENGLALERNAARGFAAGAVVATAVFAFFALVPGTTRPLGLYVGLAGVLGVSVGLLVTLALVGWRAYRLTRRL